MSQARHVQCEAQSALDTSKMPCGKIACLITHTTLRQSLLAHEMSQVGDVDFHRARGGAQAVASTGLVALIAILLDEGLKSLGVTARLAQVGDFALDDDALARRERQATGEAIHLTEAALDALVSLEDTFYGLTGAVMAVALRGAGIVQPFHFQFGQGLEVLDEALGVVVEDDAGIEQIVRVENLLQFAHGGKSLFAPLILDKWRHVAARAVFGLQRAVIFLDHEACHVAHHRGITLHLALVAEELVDDEVVIALEGVAVYAGILIAVVGDEFL